MKTMVFQVNDSVSKGRYVSLCVVIQKDGIKGTGHHRAKAYSRLMPVQTVSYETGRKS